MRSRTMGVAGPHDLRVAANPRGLRRSITPRVGSQRQRHNQQPLLARGQRFCSQRRGAERQGIDRLRFQRWVVGLQARPQRAATAPPMLCPSRTRGPKPSKVGKAAPRSQQRVRAGDHATRTPRGHGHVGRRCAHRPAQGIEHGSIYAGRSAHIPPPRPCTQHHASTRIGATQSRTYRRSPSWGDQGFGCIGATLT